MAQNDNICSLFDFMCQIDHYLVIWGQNFKKGTFWVKIPFFRIFLKNLTKMTTVTLKMYLQSRVRAQNERLFILYQNPL